MISPSIAGAASLHNKEPTMKTFRIAAAAAALMLASAIPAAADWIDDRQANQIRRIEQGWRSGQLTRSEYNRLIDQQREIARLERILARDGRLTPAERAHLAELQNESSRSIWAEKHDRDTQWNRRQDRDWTVRRHPGRDYGYGYGRDYGYGYGRDAGPYSDRNPGWGYRRWWQWSN